MFAFNNHFKFLLTIDLFGKVPKLYYKGKPKRRTFIGSFSTIIYMIIYIGFFIYKIKRMLDKVDVNYYETYIFTEGVPSIDLNNDNYYGGFALGNPLTLKTFIDETIYYPKGIYRTGIKIDDEWVWNQQELDLERCKLENFGSKYRDLFKNVNLDNLYCLKNLNATLKGYMTSDVYSYFKIDFYPCRNSTANNFSCKPTEIIDRYITSTFIEFKMQDIELTPNVYATPVEFQRRDIQGVAFKNLLQNIYTHLQIVNIETDEDILGFKDFANIRKEKYLKYDESFVHVAPAVSDIYKIGGSFCTVTIQLAGKVLTQKRTYTKLIDVLGEVGGFMEVIYSLFQTILFFLTDNLYDISLVNNLFSFDIEKNNIIIKNNNNKFVSILNDKKQIENPPNININDLSSHRIMNINNKESTNYNKENTLNKNKINNEINSISRNIKVKKIKKIKIKKGKSIQEQQTIGNSDAKTLNLEEKTINFDKNINDKNILDESKLNNNNYVNQMEKDKMTEGNNKNENIKTIINQIQFNPFCTYFCFLCFRKRKILENNLLDKGIELITENLDILNLFKKLYNIDRNKDKLNT